MKTDYKRVVVFLFLISPIFLFSQQKIELDLFEDLLKQESIVFKKESDFLKAQSFFLEKNLDSTLVYSMRQLSLGEQSVEIQDYCHFFRGYSFIEKKLFDEAEKELKTVSRNFYFYNSVIKLLGEIALEKDNFKQAISYLKKIEGLKNPLIYGIKKSSISQNLGISYLHLGEFENAESYLIESAAMQKSDGDTIKLIDTYGDIANLYYAQYKDELAIPYFVKAYELAKKTNNFDLKRRTAGNMAVVEENRKDFKKALVYRKEFGQWKDSLNDQSKIWAVAQLEKEFAVKQKQKEVSLLQAENKLKEAQRNRFLWAAIVLLVLFLVVAYFYREKAKTNSIISAQKQALDELNATKDKLFSIVSHDLRSSVNALKSSNAKLFENFETQNYEEVDTLLRQNGAIANGTYNLLDNLLHWALQQTGQGYFEITSMRLFFIIEQMAYNYAPIMTEKGIAFENKVSKKDQIDADQESLKIILRNLLDNAIKFTEATGAITIYSQSTNDDYCELIVEDTGAGMKESTRLELLKDTALLTKKEHEETIGTGLGLQLCKSMIKKNNGMFDIESELGKGTKMIVSLPKTRGNG